VRGRRLPDHTDNVAYNRQFWDRYATDWDDPGVRLAGSDVRTQGEIDPNAFRVVGDEWGVPEEVGEVVDEYILPYVGPESVIAEIGCGGGRLALRVAGRVREYHGFDVAPAMLERARQAVGERDNVRLQLVDGTQLPIADGTFDFIYSFDVFVHLDLHTQWAYLKEISRVLKPGSRAFLHTANLATDEGWKLFSSQSRFDVTGFYFLTPEIVDTLLAHTDLRIVKRSAPGSPNYYVDRDYLFVLEKAD
jgi:SAM-dependent methyltransferase